MVGFAERIQTDYIADIGVERLDYRQHLYSDDDHGTHLANT